LLRRIVLLRGSPGVEGVVGYEGRRAAPAGLWIELMALAVT
jgi:hypothetical protein